MLTIHESRKWLLRAKSVIPGGTQTLSKGADQFVEGVAPVFLQRGSGAHVWDVDGNELIDFMMALGPVILGYADPAVNEAIKHQLSQGIQFSLCHTLEVEAAELLTEVVPGAEMVRFGKNGSDVTAGAIRLSRAITGRNVIAACGYHGWQDWYIGSTSRHKGVPDQTRALTARFRYNRLDDLESIFDQHPGDVAAVILEPIHAEEPQDGFLANVAALTRKHGAVLVFDEVKTGFRVGLGGAQAHFGIVPDLTCFGKAIANGMPLSALVGRREVMSEMDNVFFSFTAGGETLSLAAAIATIRTLRDTDALARVWATGSALQDGYNKRAAALGLQARTQCQGLPPLSVTFFHDESGQESPLVRSLFQQTMLDRGILYDDGYVVCAAHDEQDVTRTLDATEEGLHIVADAFRDGRFRERLRGEPIRTIFG